MISSSLGENKPCLVRTGSSWYIVTGCDDGEMPLSGMCSNTEAGKEAVTRIEEPMPPYAALVVGEAIPTIDRTEADFEALKFAVALHRDQVLGADAEYAGAYPLRRADEFGRYWRTGLKSFSSWMKCLEDVEHPGQPRWHANVKGFLVRNRRTAVRYLRAMQKRHPGAIADHLEDAIARYEDVIRETGKLDTSKESVLSTGGRVRMISTIKRIVDLEKQAVAEIEKTVEALRQGKS